ncbi:unnamed protein product [Toxocara canis]|uniref:Uncharacterized protein n=1 Tax=Toxocara canis TaxID=6265 RepID=A0A183TY83_TOXCA|nr:unnamed protein product [Toxocara canis]
MVLHLHQPDVHAHTQSLVSRIDCTEYRRFASLQSTIKQSFPSDTASDVTIMSKATWQLIGSTALQPSSLTAHSASGDLDNAHHPERFSSKNILRGQHQVQRTRCRMDLQDGIYATMDALPCKDPGRPTAVNVGSVTSTNSSAAKDLQRRYPQVFSPDLGRYNLSKAVCSSSRAPSRFSAIIDPCRMQL